MEEEKLAFRTSDIAEVVRMSRVTLDKFVKDGRIDVVKRQKGRGGYVLVDEIGLFYFTVIDSMLRVFSAESEQVKTALDQTKDWVYEEIGERQNVFSICQFLFIYIDGEEITLDVNSGSSKEQHVSYWNNEDNMFIIIPIGQIFLNLFEELKSKGAIVDPENVPTRDTFSKAALAKRAEKSKETKIANRLLQMASEIADDDPEMDSKLQKMLEDALAELRESNPKETG